MSSGMARLLELRDEMDAADGTGLDYLVERIRISIEIGEVKKASHLQVRDPQREVAKIRKFLIEAKKRGISLSLAHHFLRFMMEASIAIQSGEEINGSLFRKDFCYICSWGTAGWYDAELDCQTCPACHVPLL